MAMQMNVHYVNAGIPGIVEENFEGFDLGRDDLSLQEFIQYQETVYQSLQATGGSDRAKASVSTDSNHEQSGGKRQVSENEEETSQVSNVESQLALDEALARTLQLESENQYGIASLKETTGSEVVNREVNSTNTSRQVVRQDDIDPDDMTYEQLRSLEESIGNESRGLSEEVISYLESSKYKSGTGFLSKKDKHEECVICRSEYKNREKLITLPCHHRYHSECVTQWLKINKTCPVCCEEVFGS